ncbi:MAG: c-type cytochrome biogenesis protein CcsB, partial [Desulfobacterales bacterium]
MNSSLTLSITTFVYGFSAFLYLVGFVFRRQTPGVLGTWVALLGLIGNTAGIVMRWVESYRMGIG